MAGQWEVNSLEELNTVAKAVLAELKTRRVVAFYGEMGAGKTTFIKELCAVVGVSEAVSSPTFSIVNEYLANNEPVYHFDFYRLKNEQEAFDMGYEEYLYSGYFCFIEWPEKIANLLPPDTVKINLIAERERRIITLQY